MRSERVVWIERVLRLPVGTFVPIGPRGDILNSITIKIARSHTFAEEFVGQLGRGPSEFVRTCIERTTQADGDIQQKEKQLRGANA